MLPLRDYEKAKRNVIAGEIGTPLRVQLEQGLEVCTSLFTEYFELVESPTPPEADFSRSLDALFASGDPAAHVADVMFMACWELKQKLGVLTDADDCDAYELYSRCCSARRRAIKALCAAEMVVCDKEKLPSELIPLYRTELACALAVRRAFAEFRGRIAQVSLSGDDAVERVRGVGAAVVRLINSEGYLSTRADDRLRIRKLQRMASEWLRSARAGEANSDDVVAEANALVDTLRNINRRIELIEHDRALADRLYDELFGATPRALLNEAILEQLEPLRGREDEIDGLLAMGVQPAEPWRPLLERLREVPVEPSFSTSRKIYLRKRRAQSES